ncbi:unnamed protein product [Caenorhabditis angaria]|uniref:Uncharacterized protein n=1 Tax=Caenorhabditis angaria TaxID=860376 RepID=A0A9P1MWA4_9PELO|nr:unnamed protein product [Caenorhabditis angaria]
MFSDPIWAADCSGRFSQSSLESQKDVIAVLSNKNGFAYFENSTLVLRIGDNPEYFFKAELQQENGEYLIDSYSKHCSALDIAKDLNKIYRNLEKSKDFIDILTDPYRMQTCNYANIPFSLEKLVDHNKFEFRSGFNTEILEAKFVEKDVLKYLVQFTAKNIWTSGVSPKIRFRAVKNSETHKYMLQKEFKLC